jgi:hypothetical protein
MPPSHKRFFIAICFFSVPLPESTPSFNEMTDGILFMLLMSEAEISLFILFISSFVMVHSLNFVLSAFVSSPISWR